MNKEVQAIRAEIERRLNEITIKAGEARPRLHSKRQAYLDVLGLIDSLPEEKPSKDLAEVADKYALTAKPDSWIAADGSAMPIFFMSSVRSAVKYGAEWQAAQMPMPEDTVLFQKGVAEGKRLMMEDAIAGEVIEAGNFIKFQDGTFIDLNPTEREPCFKFQDGDRVKVIIVEEDEL